jgi:hypothetical protein
MHVSTAAPKHMQRWHPLAAPTANVKLDGGQVCRCANHQIKQPAINVLWQFVTVACQDPAHAESHTS